MRHHKLLFLALGALPLALFVLTSCPVALASWKPDRQVSYTPGRSGLSQSNAKSVAFDSSGTAHVVWHDDSFGNYELFYLRFDTLTTFPAEPRRLTRNSGMSREGSIALLADSTVLVTWSEDTDRAFSVIDFLRFHPDSSGLTDSGMVNTELLTCVNSAVAAGPDTSAHIIWAQSTGLLYNIFYRKWKHGWEAAPLNISNSPGLCASPCIAVSESGDVHVAWSDNVTGNYEIFYRKYTNASGWGPVERVSNSYKLAWTPTIAVDRSSSVFVAWADKREGFYDIYFRRFLEGIGWGNEKRLSVNMSISANPSASTDCDGNLHVVWEDFRDGNDEIYYRRVTSSDGPGWDPIETRLTKDLATSWDASVVADCSGNVHVVWADGRLGNFEIFYKLGIQPVPVSVELLSFQAECTASGVMLTWELDSDSPLTFLDIYRQEDDTGVLMKLTETSLLDVSQYLDGSAEVGKEYVYFLAVWEGKGDEETMFGPLRVHFDPQAVHATPGLAVWPNPSRGVLNVQLSPWRTEAPYSLRLYDVAGRFLQEIASGRSLNSAVSLTWNVPEVPGGRLGPGVYIVSLEAGGLRVERKVLILGRLPR